MKSDLADRRKRKRPHVAAWIVGLLPFVATLGVALSCGKAAAPCAATCGGCCTSGGACISAESDKSCGQGGAACADCTGLSQRCDVSTHTCVARDVDAGTCSATCSGCCSAGRCIPPTSTAQSATSCGSGGEICMPCQAGWTCAQGKCAAIDAGQPSVTGEPCTTPSQCSALGANAVCKTAATTTNTAFRGGYCSQQPCNTGTKCADDALCVSVPPTLGENAPLCLKKCIVALPNCRDGYECFQLESGDETGICYIPRNAFAVSPSDKVGRPCAQDSQCQNPPNPPFEGLGFCAEAALSDGGASGFTDGMCLADCTESSTCGDGGLCLAVSANRAVCFPQCTGVGAGRDSCRTGYVCAPTLFSDGGLAAEGFCNPSCSVPGASCNAGFFCDAGYCTR